MTAPTLTNTVEDAVKPRSFIVYPKLSKPSKSAGGVYVNAPSGPIVMVPPLAEVASKLEGMVRADAEVQAEGEAEPVGDRGAAGAAVAVVLTRSVCVQ